MTPKNNIKNKNKGVDLSLKKKFLVLFMVTVIILIFSLNISAESRYNWTELIKNTKSQLKNNKKNIILNYTLAVAYANIGEIKKAYNIIDVFGSSVSREEFNTAVSPYLNEWNIYKNTDDLLVLNFAAFKEVINKNYSKAVPIFEYIYKIDSNNLWAINHAAAALVEIPEYDKALDYAEQALSKKENEYSHLIKGYVFYEKGNYIKALFEAAAARNLFKSLADEEYHDFTE